MNSLDMLNAQIADMERRLRIMEGTQRSGLGSTQLDSGTAGYEITSFGVDNWQDDSASTTPEITMSTGSRVLIFAAWRPVNVGEAGVTVGVDDFRSSNAVMGIQIDSTEPQDLPPPNMRSNVVFAGGSIAGAFLWVPMTITVFREDLEPGEHTFTMRFYALDNYPSGTVNPIASDTFMAVLPLGYS